MQTQTGAQEPNFSAADVAPALDGLADAADMAFYSRVRVSGPSISTQFVSPICVGTTCSFTITVGGETYILDNINDDDDDTETNFQPIAIQNNIPLVQARSRETQTGDTVDFYSYGGWLDNSLFGIGVERVISGEFAGLMLVYGASVGDDSGTNPTGLGSATWNGVMVGRDVSETGSQGNIVQGNAAIVIDDLTSPDVDVTFSRIVDLNAGTSRNDMAWENIALTDGRFEAGSTGNTIEGSFYGSDHEEVGGVFERDSILGAFGAQR